MSQFNNLNVSKLLNSSSKVQSTSFSKSKELNEYKECFDNNIPSFSKKVKKSKPKPYDIETKSKSDFTYNASILDMPFPGNDPLPL